MWTGQPIADQLLVAGCVTALSALFHGLGVLLIQPVVYAGRRKGGAGRLGSGVRLICVALLLLAVHLASAGGWAAAYLLTGVSDSLEPALYFALSTYTTLGFGDVLAPEEWRLLTGFAAMNGLLMFGLSAAVLVDSSERLRLPRRMFTEN
jgi:hypothetical protein